MIEGRLQLAAIPQRDHHHLTRALIEQLLVDGEVDRIILFDNDSIEPATHTWLQQVSEGLYGDRVELRCRHGDGIIYRLWNEAWADALELGPVVDLAILNNDIMVPEGIIGHLSRALRRGVLSWRYDYNPPTSIDDVWISYPDWRIDATRFPVEVDDPPLVTPTSGTMRAGGMSGFCFMLKPEAHLAGLPFIDEKFRWYCGDGDLVDQTQKLGATAARVEGLPLGWLKSHTSDDERNKKWTRKMASADMSYGQWKFPRINSHEVWHDRWYMDPQAPLIPRFESGEPLPQRYPACPWRPERHWDSPRELREIRRTWDV